MCRHYTSTPGHRLSVRLMVTKRGSGTFSRSTELLADEFDALAVYA